MTSGCCSICQYIAEPASVLPTGAEAKVTPASIQFRPPWAKHQSRESLRCDHRAMFCGGLGRWKLHGLTCWESLLAL